MYKRHEAAAIRQQFWTRFGQYMKPVPSAWNPEVNWVNYHTGVKDIFFRMDASNKQASCSIELMAKDKVLRHRYFQHFVAQRKYFEQIAGADWEWQQDVEDEHGHIMSCIRIHAPGLQVMDPQDWPAIISFLKPRLIAIDAFWADARDGFEVLAWL